MIGKGMVVKMSSNQVKQLKNKMYKMDEPNVIKKKVIKGSAIDPATAIAMLGLVNEFLDNYPSLKNFIGSIGEDIRFLFENPIAVRYKFIISTKIPNLNKRYRDISVNIETTKKRMALLAPSQKLRIRNHQNRIINFEAVRDKVGNHIKSLIERLPAYKQMAEERNEVLKERQAKKLEAELNKAEDILENLQKKAGQEKEGDGMQIEGYDGRGMQIEGYYGRGQQMGAYGSGVVIDKIKSRIKEKHIDPLIEREKEKAKKEMHKQLQIQKKKIEEQAKQKLQTELSKAKNKASSEIPFDLSKFGTGKGKKKK